jgi:hypothetical protein
MDDASIDKKMIPESSINKYYRVDRREIHYLKFILEGYGGLAIMRTLDSRKGLVVLHVGPGCEEEVDMIIRDLQRHVRVEVTPVGGDDTL